MRSGTPGSRGSWSVRTGFAVVAYFALFWLPFFFPPRQLLVSASYAFGFNNSIAVLATAGLLGVAILYRLRRRSSAGDSVVGFTDAGALAPRLSPWVFAAMTGVYAVLTAAMYVYSRRAATAPLTWESRHFLHRIKLVEIYGLNPYSDVHVEYGPALMYPPIYLHRLLAPLGVSTETAYFLCHLLLNVAGLWCLWYLLQHAVASSRLKAVTFVVIGLAGFAPYMGLNGVVLRYVSPFASVLAGHRGWQRLHQARSPHRWIGMSAVVGMLAVVNLLLSPEIAVAFALGWLGYSLLRVATEWRLLAVSVVGLAATALGGHILLPAQYSVSLLRFSQGANNLPLVPAAHILLYAVTLFLIVPPLLAAGWRGERSDGALLGALGVLSVVMMPGALGRCDPPHVLFYGLVVSMLLMVNLASVSAGAYRAYTLAYVAVFIGLMQVVNLVCFLGLRPAELLVSPVGMVRRFVYGQRAEFAPRDHAYLAALDKYPAIGLPFATYGGDNAAEDYLFASHRVEPEFYVGTVGVYTEADIARKLADTVRHEFVLIKKGWGRRWQDVPGEKYLRNLRWWFLYPVRLRWIRPDLDANDALNAFIVDHYQVVEQIGPSVIMRRIEGPRSAVDHPPKP